MNEQQYAHWQDNFGKIFERLEALSSRISELDKGLSVAITTSSAAHNRIEGKIDLAIGEIREIRNDLGIHEKDDNGKFQSLAVDVTKLQDAVKNRGVVIAGIIAVLLGLISYVTGIDFRP